MNWFSEHTWRGIVVFLVVIANGDCAVVAQSLDPIAKMQSDAVAAGRADWGHWGPNADTYSSWTTHTNRLIPIYTFGVDLKSVSGENSLYRQKEATEQLYGDLPVRTVNPQAEYFDQTDVYRIQQKAIDSGVKRVILFVFDGMDWDTTRVASIVKARQVGYQEGRGNGLNFQDYINAPTDYGFFVTSPHNEGTSVNVDKQIVTQVGGKMRGGYDPHLAGQTPWDSISDSDYPIGKSKTSQHAFTDSASSATSLTCGIKTYNGAVNVDPTGREVLPIARTLQDKGFAIGVVTSVPISHATPACAYANNVNRSDYQDLTRDLVGLPSSFHPGGLVGVDVLIGAGWGEDKANDGGQGDNFVPGNRYITDADLAAINVENGGEYVVAVRTPDTEGADVLNAAVEQAQSDHKRMFGFFGVSLGHLPFATADGNYDPVRSVGNPEVSQAEQYSEDDLRENVTLSSMALAAVNVLQAKSDRWWLMVEAGDVDWACHSNNIDNAIGAILSGDEAFSKIVQWIEQNGGWNDTAVIVTADHGHYFQLDLPESFANHNDE